MLFIYVPLWPTDLSANSLKAGAHADEILRMATMENADLIVLTSRGEGRSSGFGRIAQVVIESADVPVHVLNP